jgi:hypothetical protein
MNLHDIFANGGRLCAGPVNVLAARIDPSCALRARND